MQHPSAFAREFSGSGEGWRPSADSTTMKALLLTNEYPPYIYGGAGVHVEFLSRELAQLMDVEVRCFGDQNVDEGPLRVRGYPEPSGMTAPDFLRPVFGAMARDLAWAGTQTDAGIV